ncbi:hypothetical protein GMO_06320 [Gluconobacter morbifer G707]|uniref:Uncharacterized protein n=1 Tax=Gluconobacter morbifer G707 TaxID=1088869 RepID=G6XGL7_9PROT|nr:hypothetical protein GMO_06320 [Gluconobacter morbifer G707]
MRGFIRARVADRHQGLWTSGLQKPFWVPEARDITRVVPE